MKLWEVIEYPSEAYKAAGYTFEEIVCAYVGGSANALALVSIMNSQYGATDFRLGKEVEVMVD